MSVSAVLMAEHTQQFAWVNVQRQLMQLCLLYRGGFAVNKDVFVIPYVKSQPADSSWASCCSTQYNQHGRH